MEDKEMLEEDYEQFEETESSDDEELEEEKPSKKEKKVDKTKATTPFEKAIKDYLDTYSLTDEAFKERYNNPEKNIVS